MTLNKFEQKLKQANPNLHIKRYGTDMAAIHNGTEHVCRVPQGEITLYNVTKEEVGYADQHVSFTNPHGEYHWNRMIRRGRGDVAHMLSLAGLITQRQAAKLRV